MSSFIKNTIHPKTGNFEPAYWLDDYFGSHHYGVKFMDGSVYSPERSKLETNDDPTTATWDDFPTVSTEATT